MRKNITDRTVKALKPGEEVLDAILTGFGVRAAASGAKKSFFLLKRYPGGSGNSTRRVIGHYPVMPLQEARSEAARWLALIARGIDPVIEIERSRKAELDAERKRQAHTFGAAFEDYSRRKLAKLRTGRVVVNEMRREFAAWMDRPLADISQHDVKSVIRQIADKGPAQAHVIYGMLRTFLNWVADSGDYGTDVSPCAKVKPTVLIGPHAVRSRVLRDHEIAAYWRASEALGYPFSPFLKLLLLTACRRNEVAEAQWSEFDLDAKLWLIPAARMKGGAAHVVPLAPDTMALLENLPRFRGGDFIFSTTGGARPISGFSKAKKRLDALMRADLDAQGKAFEDFVLHDIRRTCRTRFSALPVEDVVRELLLAHARPGLHRIYDLHAYEDEKRRALELWHQRLRAIVELSESNVIPFTANA